MTGSPDQPVGRENTGPLYPTPSGCAPAYFGPPQPVPPKNRLGVVALVLAVVGLLGVATVLAPIALGSVAVVIGFIGHARTKRGIADNGGVAIGGIVLGALAIVLGLAFIAIWTTVWRDVHGDDYIDCVQKAGDNSRAQQRCADQFRNTLQDRLSITLSPASAP